MILDVNFEYLNLFFVVELWLIYVKLKEYCFKVFKVFFYLYLFVFILFFLIVISIDLY